MRLVVLVALAVGGCTRAPVPPPAATVELPAAPRVEAPPASAAPAAPPAAPPSPNAESPCWSGSAIDPTKVEQPLAGSFSGPGLDEIIGEVHCDPDDLGGYALVRRTDGVWRTVRVARRGTTRGYRRDCRKLRLSTGRDLPICRQGAVYDGATFASIVALDYTRPDLEEAIALVHVGDTSDTPCGGQIDVVVATIEDVAFVDLNHDGNEDVRITVRAAKLHIPPLPPCPYLGDAGKPPRKLPRPPAQRIDFIAGSETLTPTPASARALAALEALMPP